MVRSVFSPWGVAVSARESLARAQPEHDPSQRAEISRRTFFFRTGGALALAAGGLVLVLAPSGAAAAAGEEAAEDERLQNELKKLFGNKKIGDGSATLRLETPTIAENGNVVPIEVEAKPEAGGVKAFYIFGEKNPAPLIGRFGFGPAAAGAFIATNIRLAKTSRVRAVAELKSGKLVQVAKEVKVTIGGCGG